MENKYSMTFPQKNIWLVETFYNNKKINIISGSLKINQGFNIELAEKTINKFIELNDAMRFTVKVIDSKPVNILNKYEYEKIDVIKENNENKIKEIKAEILEKSIDIFSDKLYSYLLIDKGNGKGEIVLKVHHIICDAWSVSKMGEELSNIYEKYLVGDEEFNSCPSYLDFMQKEEEYLNSEKKEKDKEFWKEYLKGYTEAVGLKEFTDNISYTATRYSTKLDKKLEKELNKFCIDNKCSPYTVFMVALAIYMERVTEKTDIVIGTPVLNRSNFVEKNMQGMFVSTMPVRFKIDEQDTFLDMCKKQALESMSLFRHQKYPYSKIAEDVKENNGLKDKLYRIMLSYQNARTVFENKEKYEITWDFSGEIQDELEIHVSDLNNDGSLNIFYDYLVDVFEPIEIEYLSKRIEEIIRDGIENNKTIETINIMPEEEKNKILYEFNNTKKDYPKDKTVVDLFEEQVEKTPNNIALVFEGKEMTYKELNDKANSVAWYLKEQGVKENDFVGITLDKSLELMITILASLKVGACYVPVDKSYNEDRKNYMLKDANCKMNIVDNNKEKDIINNFNISEFIFKDEKSNPIRKNSYTWDSLVYVMYTSGTTGKPKGAMITNRNIVRLVKNTNYIEFKEDDRIIQTGATVFDACTFEYWGALLNGLRLYLIKKEDMLDPNKLEVFLKQNNITIMWLTAPLFNQMLDINKNIFSNLRVLLTGGDVLSVKHINKMMDNCPNIELINGYGPTENTTFSNCHRIIKKYEKRIPIGCPIANSTSYVVDSKGRLLPIFVDGELYAGGDGVSKGYLNNNELTNQKYISDFFTKEGQLYKTDDIVRWLNDGTIDFIGRRDNQVKIRGFRIELDEIKLALMQNKSIKDSVIVIKEDDGNKKILAYFTSDDKLDTKKIVSDLKEELPLYMIPSGILQLDSLPINQNGKIDRKALPDIKVSANLDIEKLTKTEHKLVKILSELQVESDNMTNVFDAGLDSLSVINFAMLIQEKFNIDITTRDIMKFLTIHKIANYIENYKEKKLETEKKDSSKITSVQMGIFMDYLKDPESTLYNIPFKMSLNKNQIDLEKLIKSIENVLESQLVFSLKFQINKDEIIQIIDKSFVHKIVFEEVSKEKYEECYSNFIKPFDLINGPIYEIKVYVVEDKINILCDFHHIIFDGYSLQLFINEIERVYKEGITSTINNTYIDYANSEIMLKEDLKYYQEMFAEPIEIVNIPYDFSRGKKADNIGNKLSFTIDKGTYKKLNTYIKNNKYTINSVMQSAYIILLSKYMYAEDIVIGIADAGRSNVNNKNTIGMFTKTLPFRYIIDWNKNIKECIKEIQNKILDNYSHDSCTYEDLLNNMDIQRVENRNPLFDSLFVCQNKLNNIIIGNNEVNIEEIKQETSKFDMTFEIVPSQENLQINLEYNTNLFASETMKRFINNYCNVLKDIILNADKCLKDIDMISKKDKELIVNKFNDTKTKYPEKSSINKIFEDIVKKYGDKTAIIFEEKSFTYNELNSRANKLARHLLNKNIIKGSTVGIMIDKSIEYMVAVLGVLKAGYVYMPISMDAPNERLKYFIEDSNAQIIITTKEFDRDVNISNKIFIDYEESECDYNKVQNDSNLDLDIMGDDKAYIMYTSGTTGTPKGIAIPHKGILRLLLNTNLVNYCDDDIMLLSGSTTFDTSGFEIWGAMFYGMTLHIMRKKNILTPSYYEEYLKEHKITTTLIPTPIFNKLAEHNVKMFCNLKTLYVCGDVLLTKYANNVIEKCINTKLINTYGPTENSVICTFYIVNDIQRNDISIGKPISNSTCYVVDKCGKLCPIGVPGDLYTGGDGLAFGYLNKEEMTKDKFTTLNAVNKKIYKTGDLTSYSEDGNIRFFGRIDSQIKLRGQRIEILEIQNKILELEDINECIVVLKKIENNEFLVAYYTSKSNMIEDNIVKYLNEFLPKYMIPSRFVKISKMPLNQNGKIDRKLLPDVKIKKAETIYAKNELELKILNCFKHVLNNQDIGMTDNFFEQGGDSLLAMTLVSNLEVNEIKVSYADIFKYTTPKDIYDFINNSTLNNMNNVDITNYDYISINKLLEDESNNSIKTNISGVLLTGATGFLGIHVLAKLIDSGTKKIYCIVRKKDNVNATSRLIERLNYYFDGKYNKYIGNKIIIVEGDAININSIDNKMIDKLKDEVNVVINCLAYVKHLGDYDKFYKINVESVNNLIEFCIMNNKKLIQISTISISGNIIESGRTEKSNVKAGTVFDETKLYIGQELNNVYVLSKFIAERTILQSIVERKLDATIIRVGNLMGRYSDGKFQHNKNDNAFINRIKSFINLKLIPENIKDIPLEFTPIDLTAEAIIKLSTINNKHIYHVYDKYHTTITIVKEVLDTMGYILDYKTELETTAIIKDKIKNDSEVKQIFGIIQDLDDDKKIDYSSNIKVSCENTVNKLKEINFEWPKIDEQYVQKFFDGLEKEKFFKGE